MKNTRAWATNRDVLPTVELPVCMLHCARTSFFRSLLIRQEEELNCPVVWKAERRDWPSLVTLFYISNL